MSTVTVGLVVGKFCPLHRGHQALLDFAAARSDRLAILSWTKPEFPGCGPARRADWLAALYPEATRLVLDDAALAAHGRTLPANDAPDAEQRAFVAWVCRATLRVAPDRVFTSEAYGDGFAASLAAALGRPVEHVPFDPARARVPVSGTRLRAEPGLWREWLPEVVRRSLEAREGSLTPAQAGARLRAAAPGL